MLSRSVLAQARTIGSSRIAGRRTGAMASTILQRGLKFQSKQYNPSPGFSVFSEELEQEIRHKLTSLPSSNKVFQNADGTARNPSDEELKVVAELGVLAQGDRATFLDRFRLSQEQRELLAENSYLLDDYVNNGKRILDKIPVEDPTTGEITWTVIRENQKEGWENLIYYGYVPALLISLFFALFLDKENISDWAMEELRLRAQERYNSGMEEINNSELSAEERKKQDALIVERIISGDYDRLAGLRKAGSDLPASLL
ncbi:hypothetical protein AWJ20_4833 [Sugiyamaella lignohabitans]|uniref:Uncharacterized protein n=1 Tax=Sugiyamaella lignohabitans TaxID=796027 RepID=A0A167EBT9_9ASCO|nr:uncharacterized protein AWJ20_4833 [Sugiyamaella lignohabitans]ANB13882.1 hypothetical protein AWJ20_4833 [Sugiyamaella lignohabitans]